MNELPAPNSPSLILCIYVVRKSAHAWRNSNIDIFDIDNVTCMNKCELHVFSSHNPKFYGPSASSVAAPHLWNSLPLSLRTINEYPPFKSQLKTYLFRDFLSNQV